MRSYVLAFYVRRHREGISRSQTWRLTVRLAVPAVLVAACSAANPYEDAIDAVNEQITVCVGTSAGYAEGETAHAEVLSQGRVLAEAVFSVPGQVVLSVASSAEEPRLLLDGAEWASSPRGGGWGISTGEGCPVI